VMVVSTLRTSLAVFGGKLVGARFDALSGSKDRLSL
jgi:hypothetical protein